MENVTLIRNNKEVHQLMEICLEVYNSKGTKYNSKTFEQGVLETIDWLFNSKTKYPMNGEEEDEDD